MVKLKYHLAEEEYFNFNYYTSWASPDKKGYRMRYYSRVFLLYAAVAVLYILANHESQLLIDFAVFGAIGLVYFLLIPLLVRKSVRRRVKEVLSEENNKHILEESEITLDDNGITDKDTVSESRYNWEAIIRKIETTDSYYLYTNSYHAIVIPKRAISNSYDRQELERMMNRHLSLSAEF